MANGGSIAKELARELKDGYTLRRLPGNGHYEIIGPDGEKVRKPGSGMPLHVPFSPKAYGTLRRLREQLQRAGVIA